MDYSVTLQIYHQIILIVLFYIPSCMRICSKRYFCSIFFNIMERLLTYWLLCFICHIIILLINNDDISTSLNFTLIFLLNYNSNKNNCDFIIYNRIPMVFDVLFLTIFSSFQMKVSYVCISVAGQLTCMRLRMLGNTKSTSQVFHPQIN